MASSKLQRSSEEVALLMIRGVLLELPQEERNKILDLKDEFKAKAKESGNSGTIALSLAALEIDVEGVK